MAFDKKGYLWVGSQDGAAYYNGRAWTVVNMPNRTISNFVRSIVVASDESIWFGRQEGGVSRLKDGTWTNFDEKSGAYLSFRMLNTLECGGLTPPFPVWSAAWRRSYSH